VLRQTKKNTPHRAGDEGQPRFGCSEEVKTLKVLREEEEGEASMSDGNREEVHGPSQRNCAGLKWLLCGGALICKIHNPDAILSLRILQRLEGMASGVMFACARNAYGMKSYGHLRIGDRHESMSMCGQFN
jgi:hypothetical protein